MRRDYHKWFSPRLGRDMEMLVYGHGGLSADRISDLLQGRFYEFEDRGMVGAIRVARSITAQVQLFCVDSVDAESWYNRNVATPVADCATGAVRRSYIIQEVIPLVKTAQSGRRKRAAIGMQLWRVPRGVTMALRHGRMCLRRSFR
jgi:esterase/lipase superfamily enzyme